MDRKAYQVREDQWRQIVNACIQRDPGVTKSAWLAQNGICPKSFYYWQRRFREEALEQRNLEFPTQSVDTTAIDFVDVTSFVTKDEEPALSKDSTARPGVSSALTSDLTIQTGDYLIHVGNDVQESTLTLVLKVLSHA